MRLTVSPIATVGIIEFKTFNIEFRIWTLHSLAIMAALKSQNIWNGYHLDLSSDEPTLNDNFFINISIAVSAQWFLSHNNQNKPNKHNLTRPSKVSTEILLILPL